MKTLIFKYICVILMLACNSFGYAQSALAKKVMANLNPKGVNWFEELIVEKVVPNSKNEIILVLPEFLDSAEMYYTLKTWIVIAENSGKILSKTFINMESDAVVLTRFSIDTAPYQISENSRAFGIRTVYRGSSRANPYDYESISLFIQQSNELKIILKDFVLEQFDGEWDTNCAGEFNHQQKVLIVSNNLTNGYYNITVKNKITKENTFVDKLGECDGNQVTTTEKTVLKYQNDGYK